MEYYDEKDDILKFTANKAREYTNREVDFKVKRILNKIKAYLENDNDCNDSIEVHIDDLGAKVIVKLKELGYKVERIKFSDYYTINWRNDENY